MEATNKNESALSRTGKFIQSNLVLVVLVVLIVLTAILEPRFISDTNIANILRQFGAACFRVAGHDFRHYSRFY